MANVKISQLPSLSTMTNEAIVPVVAGGVTQQITGANLAAFFGSGTGNIGFVGDAIYDYNGMIIENADLTHGATAAVILPSNGNSISPVQITNTYGNITLNAGPDPGNLQVWQFGANGALSLPYGTIKTTSDSAIAIGVNAGTGGSSAVSLGSSAGAIAQSFDAIAIGGQAGANTQGGGAIAIGGSAGYETQGAGAIAIGPNAGQFGQGTLAIAIGASAGYNVQASSSIVINATGSEVNNTTENSFVVKPVRQVTGGSVPSGFYPTYYNPTTGEFIVVTP